MSLRALLLVAISSVLFGCALPKVDESGQSLVPETDVVALAQTREGINLLKNGRNLDAEIQFRKALLLIPDSAPILQNLGVALFQQARFDEALEVFSSVPVIQTTAVSKMWLARAKVELGDKKTGLEMLDLQLNEALQKGDFVTATQISRTLASIYFGIGDENSSLSYSWISYSLDYGSPETVYRHARLLMACGLEKKANEILKTYGGEKFSNVAENVTLAGAITAAYSGEEERAQQILLERFLSGSADRNISEPAKLLEFTLGLRESVDDQATVYLATNLKERLIWPVSFLRSLKPYLISQ